MPFGVLIVAALTYRVFAQRTMIQLMQAEDNREHCRPRETFEFWRSHVIAAQRKMKAAQILRAAVLDILPHPNDVCSTIEMLTFRTIGPLDEEEAARSA